jgi:hypothetical protein
MVLPIILSSSIRDRMRGTNASTGWLSWLARNPDIPIVLAEELRASVQLTRDSLVVGYASLVIQIRNDGSLAPSNRGILREKLLYCSTEVEGLLRQAKVLGKWLAPLAPGTVFRSVGITL